jgi:glycolate oxidase iron-sulfur subunit
MRLASRVLRYSQTLGLMRLAGRLIPPLKAPIALLPALSKAQTWRAFYPATNAKKGEVNLFLGCVTNAFDADTLRASILVLNKLGVDVHIPVSQTCCGGLSRQQGNTNEANKLIDKNKLAFNNQLPTITVASGCGAGLQDYTDLNIMDISAYLASADWKDVELLPLKKDIAVHDPCTLRNVQKSHNSVYDLLKKIPQANVKPLSGNAQCCGGAGAYMLKQPEMAKQLLSDKMSALQKSECKILATSNVGCALHIASSLRAQQMQVEVLHPVTIIAKQMTFNGKLD